MSLTAPRQLRMLRIDDDLTPGGAHNLAPQYAEQAAPTHLETVFFSDGVRELPGIRGWNSAVHFWKSFEQIGRIDLVVSDVKFLDDTSPLHRINGNRPAVPMPTGISHFKALAAIARSRGAPLGIALHTADPTIWEDLWNDSDPAKKIMASLAAHEIGELAAIMGDAAGLPETGAEGSWNWLRQFTVDKPNFRQAIPLALSNYRRRLNTQRMLPDDWQRLVSWCGERAVRSDPIILVDDNDPGFPILGEDGLVDTISLRSIFADVPLKRRGFAFGLTGLPNDCFKLQDDDDFHELDENRNPKIGALVWAAGSLARDYQDALRILEPFRIKPDARPGTTLIGMKTEIGASHRAAALAILFQDVRREHAKREAWRNLYRNFEWVPSEDAFTGNKAVDARTLRGWTSLVANLFNESDEVGDWEVEEVLHIAGAAEGESGRTGSGRCLGLLNEMNVIRKTHKPGTYVRGPRDFSEEDVPGFPDRLPAGFFEHSGLGSAFSDDGRTFNHPSTTLRRMFGHDKTRGDGVLGRQIAQAFLDSDLKNGRKFLESFRGGRGDKWVKAICRTFAAEDLNLHNVEDLPSMIR